MKVGFKVKPRTKVENVTVPAAALPPCWKRKCWQWQTYGHAREHGLYEGEQVFWQNAGVAVGWSDVSASPAKKARPGPPAKKARPGPSTIDA